ncbi:MAG: trypsin-like peptidase domain-containing protein [Bacteroidota bacterium]
MRHILINALVAIISTVCTFTLMKQFDETPATQEIVLASNAQLVKQASETETLVNTKPRQWANNFTAESDFRSVSAGATESVVNITTLSVTGYRVASGSGVITSRNGYIITNHHVVEDGSSFEVSLQDKRTFEAQLVGSDPTTDLAVLKISAGGLRPVPFGDSDNVEVGEWVLAVGNPFNLTSTVTAGIVSAKARNINILKGSYAIESFIQTDAVVNPGNSGGALINTNGELIGINTAIISESGGYEGYSFAIPANLVAKVVRDLKDYGSVQRAVLGVVIQDVNANLAEDLGLPSIEGVFISSVSPDGSAYKAGIKKGDVITEINGIATNSVPELQEQVARFRPGDRISLEYYRNGRRYFKSNIPLKGLSSTSFNFNRQ